MKAAVFSILSLVFLAGCKDTGRVLSLSRASAVADSLPQRAKVIGYIIVHSEGDTLVEDTEFFGPDIIFLFPPGQSRTLRPEEVTPDMVAQFRQNLKERARLRGKRVVVTGRLIRGRVPIWGFVGLYMIVEKIEEANQTPELTPGTGAAHL